MSPAPANTLLQEGEKLVRQGRNLDAAEIYDKFVKAYPRHASAHAASLRRGQLLLLGGRHDAAVRHFERMARRDPGDTDALFNLAQAQEIAGRPDDALRSLETLLGREPDHARGVARRAVFLQHAGRVDEAVALLEDAESRGVRHWSVEVAFAGLAPRAGREDESISRIRAMIDAGGLGREEASGLHFQLGYLLDRVGRYDEAWEAVTLGNETQPGGVDPGAFARKVDEAIEAIDADAIRALPEAADPAGDAVLVLGSPRSGTTLVEQILAAHPRAETAGEMQALRDAAAGIVLGPGEMRWDQARVRRPDIIRASAAYLADLRARAGKVERRIDKTTHNWQLLGVACRMLPCASVVFCDRDPRDTAISCYFRLFAGGHEYTSRLDWIGVYIAAANRLMRHWERVIPEVSGTFRMTRARYEDVVADAEGEARRLVAHVGLPWDEACLSFHTRRKTPATLNNDQIGRGVYDRSVGRWRHYEGRLAPLLEALGDEAPRD